MIESKFNIVFNFFVEKIFLLFNESSGFVSDRSKKWKMKSAVIDVV